MSFEEFLSFCRGESGSEILESIEDDSCPFFAITAGKWKNPIIFSICQNNGSMRFGELQRRISNITPTALTKSLRELEQVGIIERHQYNEIPPHVEYHLTKTGWDLMPVYYEMFKWSIQYKKEH